MAKKDDNILTYVALAALGYFLYTRYAAPKGAPAASVTTGANPPTRVRDYQTAQPDYLGPPNQAPDNDKPGLLPYPGKTPGPPNPANDGYPSGYPRVYDE